MLAPGGRLLLSTPSHGRLRLAVGGIERFSEPLGDHLHLYAHASLRTLLEEFGFGEVSVRAVGGPPGLRRMLLARKRGRRGYPGRQDRNALRDPPGPDRRSVEATGSRPALSGESSERTVQPRDLRSTC